MDTNLNLNGKVVLITGAKGGLGSFTTNAFLDAGAKVAGSSRSIKDSDFPNPNFAAIPAELSSAAAANAMVQAAAEKFGKLDMLVHILGGFDGGTTVADTPDATLTKMMDMNFYAAFYAIRASLPAIKTSAAGKGGGRILAVGSMAGIGPAPMVGVYAASKAALISLVSTVAAENFEHGITANTILPSTIDTPANRAAMPGADTSKWVPPAQLAGLLLYLASDGASHINGTAIPVHGG